MEQKIVALSKLSNNKKVIRYQLIERKSLHDNSDGTYENNLRPTICVVLQTELENDSDEEIKSSAYYLPGDHLAVYPENSSSLVNAILKRLYKDNDKAVADEQYLVKIQSTHSTDISIISHNEHNIFGSSGKTEDPETKWILHERLPAPVSLREAFTRYLDITTPPTQQLLTILAEHASNPKEIERMKHLAKDSAAYETWKAKYYPNLFEV